VSTPWNQLIRIWTISIVLYVLSFINIKKSLLCSRIMSALSCVFYSDAFDTEQLLCVMEKLKHGQAVDIPKYDFKSNKNDVFPLRRVMSYSIAFSSSFFLFHFSLYCCMDINLISFKSVNLCHPSVWTFFVYDPNMPQRENKEEKRERLTFKWFET